MPAQNGRAKFKQIFPTQGEADRHKSFPAINSAIWIHPDTCWARLLMWNHGRKARPPGKFGQPPYLRVNHPTAGLQPFYRFSLFQAKTVLSTMFQICHDKENSLITIHIRGGKYWNGKVAFQADNLSINLSSLIFIILFLTVATLQLIIDTVRQQTKHLRKGTAGF